MALISRITKLFQADMHALLDKIEDPSLQLQQAIRDMEALLAEDERQARLWEEGLQQLLSKQSELALAVAELDGQLTLCFQADKHELAKALVKRKLENQQTLKAVTAKASSLQAKISALKNQLIEQQAQLASMKQKADIFLDGQLNVPGCDAGLPAIHDAEVEAAFLVEKQKWGGL